MNCEGTTVVTQAKRTARIEAPRMEVARRAPVAPSRFRFTPVCRLTRAHLSLAQRPAAAEVGREVLTALSKHLSEQLAVPVALKARLVDASLHPFSHLARQAVFGLLELHGDGLAVLEIDALATGALLQRVTGKHEGQSTPRLLSRIEQAAMGWLVLGAISKARGVPAMSDRFQPRLISVHVDRGEMLERLDARRRYLAIEVTVTIGDVRGLARLLLPALWLQANLEKFPTEGPGEFHAPSGSVDLEARCLLGPATIGGDDVRALAPGDVILLPATTGAPTSPMGPCRLLTSSFELRGALGPSGFSLTRSSEREPKESTMSHSDVTLPVDVEIELARIRVPLSQLAVLRPGGVLPLHINAAQTVTIRIGDKAVARAELVEIEGEIGARVLSLF